MSLKSFHIIKTIITIDLVGLNIREEKVLVISFFLIFSVFVSFLSFYMAYCKLSCRTPDTSMKHPCNFRLLFWIGWFRIFKCMHEQSLFAKKKKKRAKTQNREWFLKTLVAVWWLSKLTSLGCHSHEHYVFYYITKRNKQCALGKMV